MQNVSDWVGCERGRCICLQWVVRLIYSLIPGLYFSTLPFFYRGLFFLSDFILCFLHYSPSFFTVNWETMGQRILQIKFTYVRHAQKADIKMLVEQRNVRFAKIVAKTQIKNKLPVSNQIMQFLPTATSIHNTWILNIWMTPIKLNQYVPHVL